MVRRRFRVIAIVAGVTTIAAVTLAVLQGPAYVAESRLVITGSDPGIALIDPGASGSESQMSLMTQVELIASPSFVERVVESNQLAVSPDDLKDRVTVSLVGQTSIVAIEVVDREASRAVDTANAFAQEYVDRSRNEARARAKAAGDEVERRMDATRQQIAELERASGGQSQLQAARASYAALSERLVEIRLTEQLAEGDGVLLPATLASVESARSGPLRAALLGLVLGVLAGLGLALVLEGVDDSIRDSDEAEKAYGVPVLARVPAEPGGHHGQSRLTVIDQPGGRSADAYRVLRNSIDFAASQRPIKTLLITSAGPGEGAPAVAANLASAIARSDQRVALVSCDFRRSAADDLFGISDPIGLSGVLRGADNAAHAMTTPPGLGNLVLLPPGQAPADAAELLGSPAMKVLVGILADESDRVILDAPPLLTSADAATCARWADAVLIVSRAGVSSRQAAAEAREQLEQVGAHVVGVVLWGL